MRFFSYSQRALSAIFLFTILVLAGSAADAQTVRWAQKAGSQSADEGHSVCTDPWGNVYMTGSYTGTANFSGTSITSNGNSDLYVAKYNLEGQMQWVKSLGGAGREWGRKVTSDNKGNVYVCGFFENSITEGSATLTSRGRHDIFIAKYNTQGEFLWMRQIGSESSDTVCTITSDSLGNVYATGSFDSPITIVDKNVANLGALDVFISKISPSGAHVWTEQGGGSESKPSVNTRDISVDKDGNVYVIGNYNGKISIAGQYLTDSGILVAKWNTDGVSQWAKEIRAFNPLPLMNAGRSISVIANGDFYIAVSTRQITFNGVSYSTQGGAGDGWLARFDFSGKFQWFKQFSISNFGVASGVSADTSGAWVTGTFRGSVNFGGSSLSAVSLSDAYAVRFGNDGTFRWAHRFSGAYVDSAFAITTDAWGNSYAAGYFEATANFGSQGAIQLKAAGDRDIYLVRISSNTARPQLELTQNSIDFGNINQNKSKDTTFLVKSVGIQPLVVYSIKLLGAESGAFTIKNMPELPMILDTSLNYKIFLQYKSTTARSSGRIQVVTNSGNKLDTSYIELKGLKPSISFNANPLDLGTIEANKTKTERFVIRNTGDFPLLVRNVLLSNPGNAPFTLIGAPSAATVAPGDSVSFDVQFAPTAQGSYTAMLRIASDVNAGQDTNDVEIKAAATAPNSVEWNSPEALRFLTLEASPNMIGQEGRITLNVGGLQAQNLSVRLIDNSGRELMQLFSGSFAPGPYTREFSAASLPSGSYHIIAVSDRAAVRIPVIVSK